MKKVLWVVPRPALQPAPNKERDFIPIGTLIEQGYFFPQQLRRLTAGVIDSIQALCRN